MSTWMDLSSYGVRLVAIARDSDEEQGKIKRELILQNGDRFPEKAEKLGFKYHRHINTWKHPGPDLPRWNEVRSEFPDARMIDLDKLKSDTDGEQKFKQFKEKHFFNFSSKRRAVARPAIITKSETFEKTSQEPSLFSPQQETPIEVLVAQARYLGLNRSGFPVYEGMDGRFFKTDENRVVTEKALVGREGQFLRATDETQLSIAADGFVKELQKGKVLRFEDFKSFTSAIFDTDIEDNDERLVRANEAVEGAISRALAAEKNKNFSDTFSMAVKLNDNHAYIADLVRRHPEIQPMPIPIAIAAQRLLGNEADTKEKTIAVTGAGTGNLFANISSQAILKVFEENEEDAFHIRATLNSVNKPPESLIKSRADFKNSDFTLANLKVSTGTVQEIEGLSLTRTDLISFVESLRDRSANGRSVFILNKGKTREEIEEFVKVCNWANQKFYSEGLAEIDGSLHSGQHGGASMNMLVIGTRKAKETEGSLFELNADLTVSITAAAKSSIAASKVHDYATLKTWTSQVIQNRAKIANSLLKDTDAEENKSKEGLNEEQARFQTPYVSMSGIGQASTMVPRNLEGATREALGRIVQANGNIDEWIGNELAMTKEQLGKAFSPEQIDAVAVAIDAMEKGRAFLNADQTGLGKGRFLAALMRRAALGLGKNPKSKVLFITEKDTNLSDIWRDIVHIGSENEFLPFILNNNVKIINEVNDETVMQSENSLLIKALAELKHWPDGTTVHAHILTEEAAIIHGCKEIFVLGDAPLPEGVLANQIKDHRSWEPNSNIIFATYSQFNRPGEPQARRRGMKEQQVSAKSAWLRSVIDENTLLVLDESHNASSGDSNISLNIMDAIKKAGDVVFSSATWAKNAKNMKIYSRLLPKNFDTENLTEVIRRGGQTLQETMSAMLVQDGVMIRREHDLSDCEFQISLDKEHMDRNRSYMDTLAPILAEMAYLSGDLGRKINELNQRQQARLLREHRGNQDLVAKKMKSMQLKRIGFGSPLYNLSRLFMCSLLIDKAASEAIKLLNNNQKPVILLENTIQSVLKELAEEQEDGQEGIVPDFRDLMHRALSQLTRVSHKGSKDQRIARDLADGGNGVDVAFELVEKLQARLDANILNADQPGVEGNPRFKARMLAVLDEVSEEIQTAGIKMDIEEYAQSLNQVKALIQNLPDNPLEAAMEIRDMDNKVGDPTLRSVRRIRKMIDALPDLPASALDIIRDKINAAGYSCEEITGRDTECRDGKIKRRSKSNKTEIKNRFNQGVTDAVIINTSGATGIDLHAGRRFQDQRQRVLIELQIPADITKRVQALGRVHRFDQSIGPIILSLVAGLPMELRLLSMSNSKLRAMSANTTSNRDNSALLEKLPGDSDEGRMIPDLMNSVGDEVCSRYAEARPDLMRRLGFEVEEHMERQANNNAAEGDRNEDTIDNERSANEFLARLAMLPVALQEQVMQEIEAEYRAYLEELDAKGENPLKSKTLDGTVHKKDEDKVVFEAGDPSSKSQFDQPVYAQTIFIEHKTKPMRGKDIVEQFEKGMMYNATQTPQSAADSLEAQRFRILESYKPTTIATVEDGLAQGHKLLNGINDKMGKLIDFLREVKPGSEISVSIDGVVETGVITRVDMAKRGYEHLATQYDVQFFIPGESMPRSYPVQTLFRDEEFRIGEGLNGDDQDAILMRFDRASEQARMEKRTMLVGNNWRAMALSIQNKLGSMTSWIDNEGVRHRGVLVSKRLADLDFLPVNINSASMLRGCLTGPGADVFGSNTQDPSGVTIKRTKNGTFLVTLPDPLSKKYNSIYEYGPIRGLMEKHAARRDEARVQQKAVLKQKYIGNGMAEAVAEQRAEADMVKNQAGQNRPKLDVSAETVEKIAKHLIEAGVRFYINSKHRPWANEWAVENLGEKPLGDSDVSANDDGATKTRAVA